MIAYLSMFSKSIFFLISFLFHVIFLGILWLTAPEVKPPKFTTIRTTIQFENKGVAKPSLESLNEESMFTFFIASAIKDNACIRLESFLDVFQTSDKESMLTWPKQITGKVNSMISILFMR